MPTTNSAKASCADRPAVSFMTFPHFQQRLLLCARSLSRRRLHLTEPTSLASPHHPRQEVPRYHRTLSRRDRHADARAARIGAKATERMRSSITLLKTLAVSAASARSRQEALEADSAGALAGIACQAGTEDFIRGLIDSDGCRVVANDRGVRSVRYHFSNRSDDIRGLFCAALETLGIPWTRPSKHIIAVYRKAAVARLDEFVGPKS